MYEDQDPQPCSTHVDLILSLPNAKYIHSLSRFSHISSHYTSDHNLKSYHINQVWEQMRFLNVNTVLGTKFLSNCESIKQNTSYWPQCHTMVGQA